MKNDSIDKILFLFRFNRKNLIQKSYIKKAGVAFVLFNGEKKSTLWDKVF